MSVPLFDWLWNGWTIPLPVKIEPICTISFELHLYLPHSILVLLHQFYASIIPLWPTLFTVSIKWWLL